MNNKVDSDWSILKGNGDALITVLFTIHKMEKRRF